MQDKEVFLLKTNIKKLAISALMTALCIVIGLVCKRFLTFGAIRVTFENLPILLAGFLLGPIYGGAVGMAADLVSAPLSGFGINPVITLGAASVGVIAGLFSGYVIKTKGFLYTFLATISSHLVGSMIIKSLGLFMYGYTWQMLALRIPLYFVIGIAEAYAVHILLRNKRILNLVGEGRK